MYSVAMGNRCHRTLRREGARMVFGRSAAGVIQRLVCKSANCSPSKNGALGKLSLRRLLRTECRNIDGF